MKRSGLLLTLALALVLVSAVGGSGSVSSAQAKTQDLATRGAVGIRPAGAGAPTETVKLVFIHHSCGSNWLADGNGGLGIALRDNNYFVSDTNYGWGPDGIGSSTDIGHWWTWFRGASSTTYTAALYAEDAQHSSYSRLTTDPGGDNEIVMFKSCYPNSALGGNPGDAPTGEPNPLRGASCGSGHHTVANAKGIYNDILQYFETRQDKLFIAVTAPPLVENSTNPSEAANARAFNDWLVNDWLVDYPHDNVAVFDFYNVLTSNGGSEYTNDLDSEGGNHHRWWSGAIQHVHPVANDFSSYDSSAWDSHPTAAGNAKATGEFVDLLNVYYDRWKQEEPTVWQEALDMGWNLVSLPIVPGSTAIADVLSSVSGEYEVVCAHDASTDTWLRYDPDHPELATLEHLDEETPFWISMSSAATLTVTGSMPLSTTQQLYEGWNLVAYPATDSREVPHALNSISGRYNLVYGYDGTLAQVWQLYSPEGPAWANSLTHLMPGHAYWVHATEGCSLSILSGLERFGVSANGRINDYDHEALGIRWFHNWGYFNPAPEGVRFFATVGAYGRTVAQDGADVQSKLSQYPDRYPSGTVWFVGNEIGWDDGFSPAEYAQQYHDWYVHLKGLNPTFQIGAGALLPIFPGYWNGLTGIQWFGEVRTQYQNLYGSEMLIDYYNMHVYFLYADDAEFYYTIEAMRQAMADQWGGRAKPLVITEAGQLYDNATPSTIQRRMTEAFDYFTSATSEQYGCTTDGNRIVQLWAWFTLTGWSPDEGNHRWDYTALCDYDTKEVMPLGESYATYTSTYHYGGS